MDTGPGLVRVNARVLDDPLSLTIVKRELEERLAQIPDHWDPHVKLEYLKVSIRSVISENVGKNRKVLRDEILDLENTPNEMCLLRCKANSIQETEIKNTKLELIENAICRTNNDLKVLREKQSSD